MAELERFHPVLSAWFRDKFNEVTDVQKQAWPLIAAGAHTLIAAPTGSGKTLAALMPLLDRLVREKLDGDGEAAGRGVRILYVTPLKALNNDIRQHLFDYQHEWQRTAVGLGMPWPGVTVGVRTGDTTQSTRASMLRKPPDVLVTTPESLYLLLTSRKARETLRTVKHVVVDEIHDLAASERGMHFSVTLERLTALCDAAPQRIGVSATQNPVERMARFLGGWEEGADGAEQPRPVSVVESRMNRPLEVGVTVPPYGLLVRNKREDVWTPLVDEILRHIGDSGTTLIFVGNRRLCERLSARLNERCGEGFCRSHHGSVSREQRLETEELLRTGKLRCIVATSSLELGIDIGDVDHVLQIDSPYTAASGIQRFGRSGHKVGGASRGTIIVRIRGLLPEVAVLAERIGRKETDPIEVPRHSLAVLAQQITAIVAVEDWRPDALYRLICRSDAYRGFPRERFDEALELLSGKYSFVRPLIDWDREQDRLTKRPNSAMAAIIGAGTIPQSTGYPVYHAETGVHLGELDEEFVVESRVGDVFQLGAANWRIRSIRSDRVEVAESRSATGEIPFWRAEGLGRSFELSLDVGRLLDRLESMLAAGPDGQGERAAAEWLIGRHHFSQEAADSLIGLLKAQRAVSAVPTHRRIVAEWYTDDAGLTHVVIHSWFGRRFNRTWLLALQHHLENVYAHEIQSTAKDNGIELIFRVWDPAVLDRLRGVHSGNIERLLTEAVPVSPMFAARFRRLAETSLLMTRGFRRSPAWLKRLRAEELMRDALAEAGASFPLVKEAMRDCLEQLLDLRHVRQVFERMESGEIEFALVACSRPSPLAAQFFFDFLNVAVYESDALTRDLRRRMMSVSRELAAEVFGPEAEAQVSDADGQSDGGPRQDKADLRQYLRLLQSVHHLDPASRLRGPEGVLQALTPLQGLFLPVSWWETFVLPARVAGYRREDLDLLCASGDLYWIGRREEGSEAGKIAFFRADAPELAAPFIPGDEPVPMHPELYERLRARGASFLTALANETGEKPSDLLDKLLDLVWQGLVTNDQFAPVRLYGHKWAASAAASAQGKFRSGLGRWYAVADLKSGGAGAVSPERAVLAWTRHLLRLSGVLTKSVVQAFSPYDWDTHLAALSRMEELGYVTRGLLVRGIRALQFADKDTAERLREPAPPASGGYGRQDDVALLNSADPANPFGLTVDWPANAAGENSAAIPFARKPGNYLLLKDGRFRLWAANNSRNVFAVEPADPFGSLDASNSSSTSNSLDASKPSNSSNVFKPSNASNVSNLSSASDESNPASPLDPSLAAEYVRFTARYLIRERGLRKVVIESWNGRPVARTELGEHLAKLGAEKDGGAYVLWPSSV